jgi:hypothetical protein
MQERSAVSSHLFQFGLALSVSALLASALGNGDQRILGYTLAAAALICTLLWYEALSLPVLLACFFWTGLRLPFNSVAETVRWVVLGLAAIAGLLIWVRQRGEFRFAYVHLLAFLTTAVLFLSYEISPNPTLTLLKASSVGLLFVYCSVGALVYISGRDLSFMKGMTIACEVAVYASSITYGILKFPVFGNPNSLGAVMGVLAWPILLWDLLTTRIQLRWRRKLFALTLCGWLIYHSLARAGILAAVLASVLIFFALRRKRLMLGFGIGGLLAALAISSFSPGDWNMLVQGVFYKNKPGTEILDSRRPRWEETLDEIGRSPWLGNGFGTAKDISEEWKGGVATRTYNRERGSSFLSLVAGVGILGSLPPALLLLLLLTKIRRACKRVRGNGNSLDVSIPISAVLLAGLCHALFEDWLLAVGYYLSTVFWILAFVLVHREDTAAAAGVRAIAD